MCCSIALMDYLRTCVHELMFDVGSLTAFVVFNAYPSRGQPNTWEKRVVCISWLFGCYKSVVRNVEGRYVHRLINAKCFSLISSSSLCCQHAVA